MKKDEAIRLITNAARQYCNNLENNNVLFVYKYASGFKHFEASFFPRNFLHLTGVRLTKHIDSSNFYKMCLDGKLSPSVFNLSPDGTTELKLSVLSKMTGIHQNARMFGDHDNMNPYLVTDKIVGTVYACMGFVLDDENYYVPNTVIREDIRNITRKPQNKILGILVKPINEGKYSTFSYVAKDISTSSLVVYLADKYMEPTGA